MSSKFIAPHIFTERIPIMMVNAANGRAVIASMITCCLVSWVDIIIPAEIRMKMILKTGSRGRHMRDMVMVM